MSKNAKELYEQTYSLFKNTQLNPNDRQRFINEFLEIKQLKEKGLKSTTKNVKDYFFHQSKSKLMAINTELLEISEKNEVIRYKNEVAKLKELFKNKNLTANEKEYIAKKSAEINSFNVQKWMIYLKNHSKILGETFSSDIGSAFMSGF
jgi:hypothetical protein